MITPQRLSPIARLLEPLNGTWRNVNRMLTLVSLSPHNTISHIPIGTHQHTRLSTPLDTHLNSNLNMVDLSCLIRFGVKGAGAKAWLADQNVSIPDRPNTWLSLPTGGLIARLGLTEFLIEDGVSTSVVPPLTAACQTLPEAVYPVPRQDLAIALFGTAVPDLLLQTCSVNFQALNLSDRPVTLTSMAGVTVTVVPGERQGIPFYRLWCDATFGVYLWRTLEAIATELGGSVAGFDQITGLIGGGDRNP